MSKKTKKSEVELFPLPQALLELDEDGEGKGIFYFHEPEDYLYGVLVGKGTHKTIHYLLKTYIMKPCFEARQDGCDMIIKEDQVVEFPRNIKLRRRIEDHYDEILGKPIRVIYLGKRGRYKKYYVSLVEGVWTPKEKQIDGKPHKKRASSKQKKNENVSQAGDPPEHAPPRSNEGENFEYIGSFEMSEEVAALLGPPWAETQYPKLN